MKKFLLGAHMPTTGGFYHAAEFGQVIGCSAIQIFTKSNRQWNARPILNGEAEQFKAAIKRSQINYVVAHASYLINLASPDLTTQHKSIAGLALELNRCHELDIKAIVLHPGARLTLSPETAIAQVAKNIDLAIAQSHGSVKILIETMAGQGSSIGSSFEEVAQIINLSKNQGLLGVCIDTCHLFAAGYNFSDSTSYKELWHHFDQTIGLDKLGLIHLNDSQKKMGSRVDRHAEIGVGLIGLTAFKLIMNDARLITIPKILETPKVDLACDKKNLKKLIDLLLPENTKYLEDTNLARYLE